MKKLFSFFILFLFVFVCYGQEDNGNIRISRNHNGIIRSVEILDHEEIPHVPKSAKEFFEKFLQIGPDDDFIIEPHVSKRTEFRHEHYNQYFRKIKVECGGYNFHFKNDKLYFASGNYIKIDSLNTQPSISPERAEELFAKHKNIPLNSIIESHSELLVRELSTTKIKEAYPYLIFKVYILSDQLNNTEYGIIDAHTGEVLLQEPCVINYSATGTFATRYNSTKQSMTQYYNSDFHLVDSTRGAKIYTRNLDGSTNYNDVIELSDDDNNWTSAEHSSSENDMGLDVHWGFQQIYDYLLNNHGFNSFNDNGYP